MLRQREAPPLLAAMYGWLKATRLTVANDGGTAKAIDYSLKRWPALARYTATCHRPVDINVVENAIRQICLGKKNWLLTGSERAGKREAAIQSHLAMAALNGLDPAPWLRDALAKNFRPVSAARLIRCCPFLRAHYPITPRKPTWFGWTHTLQFTQFGSMCQIREQVAD